MSTRVHFINVGQGNMALLQCADGNNFVVDCNITDANRNRVLGYLAAQIGWGKQLRAFICTHRDADHMRGVLDLHKYFPINQVWDSGYPGTSTDTPEYRAYMRLRNVVGHLVIGKGTHGDFGSTRLLVLSGKDSRLPKNANAQGIVIKVEQRTFLSNVTASTIITGDSDAATWKHGILRDYSSGDVSCNVLLAAHHGSFTFFEDPDGGRFAYVGHMTAIRPAMVIVSVGNNPHGHPDSRALDLYRRHSSGSNLGNKVFRTDSQGTMKLVLKDGGGWNLDIHQDRGL